MNLQHIITIDTGAGFLRSSDVELQNLQDTYDWIPPIVSCRNLNTGECFDYDTVTHQKTVKVAAKKAETLEDVIMVDTGAGFIRCSASDLAELGSSYSWIPEVVDCHNLQTSERFQYNVYAREQVRVETNEDVKAQIEEDSKDHLKMRIFALEQENRNLNNLVNSLKAETRTLRKEIKSRSSHDTFSLFGSHDDFYEFG